MQPTDVDGRAWHLVAFMNHLHQQFGYRKQQISANLGVVRTKFELALHGTEAFDHPVVVRARKSGEASAHELREINARKDQREKIPICVEFVAAARARMWDQEDWSGKGLDQKAIYLCIGLGFDSGPRIGNLTLQDGSVSSDHCLRGRDVLFRVLDNNSEEGGPRGEVYSAGAPLRSIVANRAECSRRIESATMRFISSKTSKLVGIGADKFLGRRTTMEAELLDDLAEFCIRAGATTRDDELLCRIDPLSHRRKVVTRRAVTVVMKEMATLLGIEPARVSTKSLRKGFATSSRALGLSTREINVRAGWAVGSTTAQSHYEVLTRNKGALALQMGTQVGGGPHVGSAFSLSDMRHLGSTLEARERLTDTASVGASLVVQSSSNHGSVVLSPAAKGGCRSQVGGAFCPVDIDLRLLNPPS